MKSWNDRVVEELNRLRRDDNAKLMHKQKEWDNLQRIVKYMRDGTKPSDGEEIVIQDRTAIYKFDGKVVFRFFMIDDQIMVDSGHESPKKLSEEMSLQYMAELLARKRKAREASKDAA